MRDGQEQAADQRALAAADRNAIGSRQAVAEVVPGTRFGMAHHVVDGVPGEVHRQLRRVGAAVDGPELSRAAVVALRGPLYDGRFIAGAAVVTKLYWQRLKEWSARLTGEKGTTDQEFDETAIEESSLADKD